MVRFVIPFLMLSYSVSAQFSMNQYLSGAASDFELQVLEEQRAYLRTGNFRSPVLREVEIRAQTPDLQSGPNDFRLRVAPLNPFERKANSDHVEVIRQQLTSQRMVSFSGVLETRYSLLIQYHYLRKLDSLKKTEQERYQQLVEMVSTTAQSGKELLQYNKKLFEAEMDQVSIQSKLSEVDFLIRNSYTFEGEISFGDMEFVAVESVASVLLNSSINNPQNIYVQNEKNKALLSSSEWNIRKQESFSNIGFIQAEYRPENGVDLSEAMGLQLAFQLPIVNPDRPNLERRKLELIQDQNEIKAVEQEINTELFQEENRLEALIRQYTLLMNQKSRMAGISKSQIPGKSTTLELVEFEADLAMQEADLYKSILNSYISWLDIKSLLVQTPMVNYLSANKMIIDQEE